ncbi:MAG TPA: AbrB/MazE/SpoVT family DNA-binding domain-containing protein [Patescibacteria group bacterium]|nr:AbrB/MazE/SpoVT family DNA-binding domain-containing protein [Patescibacteria group bacterium]
MDISRMTVKGQVTIPKTFRERLGLHPGDAVEFEEEPGGIRLKKVVSRSPFARYRGYLAHLAGQDPDKLLEAVRGTVEA